MKKTKKRKKKIASRDLNCEKKIFFLLVEEKKKKFLYNPHKTN